MIYKSAFQNSSFGYASAVGVVLFIITAVVARPFSLNS
jgi:multiple sugar transport system permease protein